MPAKEIDENIYLEDDYNEEVEDLNEEKNLSTAKSRKTKNDEDEEEQDSDDALYDLKDDESEE